MIHAAEPFAHPLKKLWRPPAMFQAPTLDQHLETGPCQPHYSLLINPFYPKDANASFGKHVLTPTLALTSFAATTPAHWRVAYWDENLLHGHPSSLAPMPELVGITVHLTFAKRAFELANWYPASAEARLCWADCTFCHVHMSVRPHADVLAMGDGVQRWPKILADCEAGTATETSISV